MHFPDPVLDRAIKVLGKRGAPCHVRICTKESSVFCCAQEEDANDEDEPGVEALVVIALPCICLATAFLRALQFL
jgi:hypothetical protein